jgi:murein DD-endopeptidase MepM/ murein hydrolase activator NlpD
MIVGVPGAVLAIGAGLWLVLQAVQGRLAAVLLSYREFRPGETTPPASAAATAPAGEFPPGRLSWPVHGPVSDEFGARGGRHFGIDIAAPAGTPVGAAGAGTVIKAVRGCVVGDAHCGGGYGNHVIIGHADGLATLYGHLATVEVTLGQPVGAGQRIGTIGTTGHSTGPHLHFEVHVAGKPVNPRTVIGGNP